MTYFIKFPDGHVIVSRQPVEEPWERAALTKVRPNNQPSKEQKSE